MVVFGQVKKTSAALPKLSRKRETLYELRSAMENCGFSPQDIRRVVAELYEVFDIRGLEEAQQHYERSPY